MLEPNQEVFKKGETQVYLKHAIYWLHIIFSREWKVCVEFSKHEEIKDTRAYQVSVYFFY